MDADHNDVGAIGAYKIERTLGRGGFGVVYVGFDERLGRRAAIKQLLPALSSQREFVERFFREARAAASIDHPGIVEIYDVGWHTDGSAYFAMKLLDGDSLAQRLKARGMLTIAATTVIARQIASAVAAAHARGIIHRDLKPDNIMLVHDAEAQRGERAVVLDFGIAKLTADGFSSSQSNNRTVTGVLLGTPLYMSPEQIRGARDIDGRSDIYSLGCMVFEMLAGRPPFPGTPGEVVGMHQFVAAPSVRAVRRDVPIELDAIVTRALAKEPAARFATIEAFAEALAPFVAIDTPPPERDEAKVVDVTAETMASISEIRPIALAPTQASQPPASPPVARHPVRWPWFVAAGTLVIAAAATMYAVLAPSSKTPVAARDAAVAIGDAAAVDAFVASTDCKALVEREAWNELLVCQGNLSQAGDKASADVYYKLAILERNAKKAFEDLKDDLAAGKLGVEGELHGIPEESIYFPRALQAYATAEPDIVKAVIADLPADCDEYARALERRRAEHGPLLAIAVAARHPCTASGPIAASTDCDQARIDGRAAYQRGAFAKTVEIFQRVATCYPNNEEAPIYLAAAACRVKNADMAMRHLGKLKPLAQIVVARICHDSGLTPP